LIKVTKRFTSKGEESENSVATKYQNPKTPDINCRNKVSV